jgi:hypothetical protein
MYRTVQVAWSLTHNGKTTQLETDCNAHTKTSRAGRFAVNHMPQSPPATWAIYVYIHSVHSH